MAEAFELEDLDSVGYVTPEGLRNVFLAIENVPFDVQEFIWAYLRLKSNDLKNLKYWFLLELLIEKSPKLVKTSTPKSTIHEAKWALDAVH